LKAYWQRKSPGIPAGANRKKKINGSSPDTATSGGYHSPGDSATGIYGEGRASSTTLEDLESQYQELAVALDSSSAIISQLTENINSLVRTSKEEKKHEIHLVQKLGRSLFKLKNQTGGAEEPRGSESAAAARPVAGAPVPQGAWMCGQAGWTPQEHPGLSGEAVGTGEAAGGAGEAACHSFRAAENRELNITII
ncbi:golgin A6 family like 4, partial [Homo sapiens]